MRRGLGVRFRYQMLGVFSPLPLLCPDFSQVSHADVCFKAWARLLFGIQVFFDQGLELFNDVAIKTRCF